MTDWNSQMTTFTYNADGNITKTVMPNDTSVTRQFDANDQITKVTYGFGTGGWPVSYARGPNGELIKGAQLSGTNTWAYDPAQQITEPPWV